MLYIVQNKVTQPKCFRLSVFASCSFVSRHDYFGWTQRHVVW